MTRDVAPEGRLVKSVRTCVGCRQRADKATLIRVVAVAAPRGWVVTPDPGGSMPGRGAHLHPTIGCLESATRRKAFGRALRVEGHLDLDLLEATVTAADRQRPATTE